MNRVVLIALMMVSVAMSQRATVKYQVNPVATRGTIMPACKPTVISRESAFMCFMNDSVTAVQFVSPMLPNREFINSRISTANRVIMPSPIQIGPVQAIVSFPTIEYSFWATISSTQVLSSHDRQYSTAPLEYSYGLKQLYVPVGARGNRVNVSAYNIHSDDEIDSLAWTARFYLGDHLNGSIAIQTPTAHEGVLYFMQENTLFALSGTKEPNAVNQVLWSAIYPCGIVPPKGSFIQFKVVTYGTGASGPLVAFILYAKTNDGAGLTICRFNCVTQKSEWSASGGHVTTDQYMEVNDVTGSKDVLLLSGRITSSDVPYDESFAIMAFDMHSGAKKYIIKRSPADQFSYPSMLNSPLPGCSSTFVVQVQNKLTAYCAETGPWGRKWTSNMSCSVSPLVMKPNVTSPSESIVCIENMKSVHMVDAQTGATQWMNRIATTHSPSFVDELVWVVDADSTLYGIDPGDFVGAKKRIRLK